MCGGVADLDDWAIVGTCLFEIEGLLDFGFVLLVGVGFDPRLWFCDYDQIAKDGTPIRLESEFDSKDVDIFGLVLTFSFVFKRLDALDECFEYLPLREFLP